MRGEVRNLRERGAVVLAEVVEQHTHSREYVVLLGRALLGMERLLVMLELREEGNQEMWVELRA